MDKNCLISQIKNANNGICGLNNLGNSCYLNTSIQCLSSCWEITNYFLRDIYKNDINENNPLGSNGKLCEAYSEIIKIIWIGKEKIYTPKKFKKILTEVNPMYTGNIPQDAQEFLSFLLDCLHEDLNKVKNKPYVVTDDNSKKEDSIKSLEELYNFKRRNQSLFVDLLYGQFKTLIVCPNKDCQNEINKFEPFLNLSLPIETKSFYFKIKCFFIFYDISIKPIQFIFEFRNDCTFMALRNKISKILNIHPFSFIILKVRGGYIINGFLNSKLLLYVNTPKAGDIQEEFFVIQFNPKDFYNPNNNRYINEDNIQNYRINNYHLLFDEINSNQSKFIELFKEEYFENEEGNPTENYESYYQIKDKKIMGEINTDLNNGFYDNFILILLRITNFEKNDHTKTNRIIFPRFLIIDKSSTCLEIYNKIYEYFECIYEYMSFEEIFKNFTSDKKNNTYEFLSNNKYPFLIRIINFNHGKPCYICNDINCNNCLLPFSNEITLQDLIDKYPKNEKGKQIDNTYYYLSKVQRDKFQILIKDLAFEIIFPNHIVGAITNLNLFRNLNFKIYKDDKNLIKQIPLSKCFENFMNWEELGNKDKYYCPNCKSQQNAKTKIQIFRCPYILIIHLKRFDNNKKIDIKINYPIEGLNMEKYVLDKSNNYHSMKYDLFAIACHFEKGRIGHYYSICKNIFTKKWLKIDDNKITEIKHDEIINKDAYLLFYRRRHLENIIDLEYLYHLPFISYEEKLNELKKNEEEDNKSDN